MTYPQPAGCFAATATLCSLGGILLTHCSSLGQALNEIESSDGEPCPLPASKSTTLHSEEAGQHREPRRRPQRSRCNCGGGSGTRKPTMLNRSSAREGSPMFTSSYGKDKAPKSRTPRTDGTRSFDQLRGQHSTHDHAPPLSSTPV